VRWDHIILPLIICVQDALLARRSRPVRTGDHFFSYYGIISLRYPCKQITSAAIDSKHGARYWGATARALRGKQT